MHHINFITKRIRVTAASILAVIIAFIMPGFKSPVKKQDVDPVVKKPNILFVISDDQSFPHASAYGYKAISTPAFDRVAKEGVLFTNAFAASPGCSPSRAALLTGKNCWQIEEAATHASSFSTKYRVYPDILEDAGYVVGYTGKGWGPGNWKISGRQRNPAGTEYNEVKLTNNPEGISNIDYAGNLALFLSKKEKDKPFCFWLGGTEPHRVFDKDIGLQSGKKLEDATVPAFLPDNAEIRSDILDYCYEIEWFDKHLERAIAMLEKSGELENTIIVVTSDNGMAFPRAKANVYEYGTHVPLAIMWRSKAIGGRVVNTPVSLIDLTPTFLEAAGLKVPATANGNPSMEGISLMNVLLGKKDSKLQSRMGVYSSRERHSSARWNNLSYPQRALRTDQFLYIRNFEPDRWPAGDPRKFVLNEQTGKLELGPEHGAYHDIDAAPSLDVLVKGKDDKKIAPFLQLAVAKRPAEELFDIRKDPACVNNLANSSQHTKTKKMLKTAFEQYLNKTNDPRVVGKGALMEAYPRYEGVMRKYPSHTSETGNY